VSETIKVNLSNIVIFITILRHRNQLTAWTQIQSTKNSEQSNSGYAAKLQQVYSY